MDDISHIRLRGEVAWTSPAVCDQSVYDGTLGEICERAAADVPAEHALDAGALHVLLLLGGDVAPNIGRLRQVLVLETSAGFVVAKLGPPSGRRRRAAARAVHVTWHSSRWVGSQHVAPRRWGLAGRIATVAGMDDPTYVRMYLKRTISVDPGADLHKLQLLPPDRPAEGLGLLQVVIDRRPRTR